MVKINKQIITKLKSAKQVVILTGAGIATPEAFLKNPQMIWNWYEWRRELINSVAPNAGHYAITELQNLLKKVVIVTQNVDGLHQRAGTDNIIEFHGNIQNNHCFDCGIKANHSWVKAQLNQANFPICKHCSGRLRPGVVWFGEAIPNHALQQALSWCQAADVFFSIGTSSNVYPAAGLVDIARNNQAILIEVNPNPTPLAQSADFAIQEPAGVFLPLLVEALRDSQTAISKPE